MVPFLDAVVVTYTGVSTSLYSVIQLTKVGSDEDVPELLPLLPELLLPLLPELLLELLLELLPVDVVPELLPLLPVLLPVDVLPEVFLLPLLPVVPVFPELLPVDVLPD